MEFEAMETTIEDRVYDLEREVQRMIDIVNWMEETILAQREEKNKEEDNNTLVDSEKQDNNNLADIKLKIHIDTTEAIQQLQRIQKALQQEEEEED